MQGEDTTNKNRLKFKSRPQSQVIPLDEADPNIRDLFMPHNNMNDMNIDGDNDEAEEALIGRGTAGDEDSNY